MLKPKPLRLRPRPIATTMMSGHPEKTMASGHPKKTMTSGHPKKPWRRDTPQKTWHLDTPKKHDITTPHQRTWARDPTPPTLLTLTSGHPPPPPPPSYHLDSYQPGGKARSCHHFFSTMPSFFGHHLGGGEGDLALIIQLLWASFPVRRTGTIVLSSKYFLQHMHFWKFIRKHHSNVPQL